MTLPRLAEARGRDHLQTEKEGASPIAPDFSTPAPLFTSRLAAREP